MSLVSLNLRFMTKSLCEVGCKYYRARWTYSIFYGSLVSPEKFQSVWLIKCKTHDS